jgi:2-keto-4-pentenoate hydratase/2-oxohepta-3-ene-1,7-dioic acid hydratase in catechol pathway
MRLATIETARGQRLHVRGVGGYVDVAEATGDDRLSSLRGFLKAGHEAALAAREAARQPGTELAESALAPAVPDPRRILCLGLNYLEHVLEGGREASTWPESFVRGAPSTAAPYGPMLKPSLSDHFDYEGELGVVIGAGGRYIPAVDALAAVAGFVVLNDGSARDWQRAGSQWTPGKNFDATMPIGPELVTPDEVDVSDLQLTTVLNGQVMQSARTSQMIVDVPRAIEYFSSFTTLQPGDVIATGTPGGVGFARTPRVFLQPGDVIEVTIESIGTIRNTVVAEEPVAASWPWRPSTGGSGPF